MNISAAPAKSLPDALDARRELGARSLTAAVYEKLRADIIANRLVQNEKLHLATLQDQYGVSLSVVREALSRLVADGLVVAEAQRGFRVSPISKDDLLDVTRTRIGIESMAIELAIQNGDNAWQSAVEQAFIRMHSAAQMSALDALPKAHADFHQQLMAPCDSAWLMRFRSILFEQSERYRYASVNLERLPTAEDVDAEHRPLLDAVLHRDSAKAKAAITNHFTYTLERVFAYKGLG